MAEGLDDAARAFQVEIAPQVRPRDQAGKFVSTADKPELMFQLRPIEGDPLTGDASDAGDDARLAEIERRIADGRSEERDESRVGRRALEVGARADLEHAGRDARHARAETEQGGRVREESEQSDQDAEGGDQDAEPGKRGEGETEGQSERDAESETRFRVTTLDGKPVEKFEITVDGRTEQVSLDEALSGYIKDATFKTRLNRVAEARNAVDAQANEVAQWRDLYAQKLQALDAEIAGMIPPEPDWAKEVAVDPKAAGERRLAYDQINQKRQQIQYELQRTAQEARAEYDRNSQRYAVDQFSQFVTEANYRDERALQSDLSMMRAYLRREGFSEVEAATVFDKRMLHVTRKAALYDQSASLKPKPVVAGKGKALIPGTATPVGSAGRRHIDEAQKQLAKTGRLEDAALVMARLIR